MSRCYENFRTTLAMNLCQILPVEQMKLVLDAVDITMERFEISAKPLEIIPAPTANLDMMKTYLASMGIANRSMATLKQYKFKLSHFFDLVRKHFTEIEPNDIRLYLAHYKYEHHAGDSYLNSIRTVINSYFQWLVNNGYLTSNPVTNIEKGKMEEKHLPPLSPVELEEVRFQTENVREKALIDFLYSTGCRVSECAHVKLTDIDWRERAVIIRQGKGKKDRPVYFNFEAEISLRKYLQTRDDNTDGLFVSTKAPHQQIGDQAIRGILNKVQERTGIKISPHKFRRTFATDGIRSGMPLETVQKLMGHASPRTTLRYATLDDTAIKMQHSKAFN